MSERFKDFDAFFAEMEREPIRLKIFGEEHELPPALPASVMLRAIRMQEEGMGNIPDAQIMHLAEDIFGRERLEAWCKKGLDTEQLAELIKWAAQVYSGTSSGDEGNGKAPKKGASRS